MRKALLIIYLPIPITDELRVLLRDVVRLTLFVGISGACRRCGVRGISHLEKKSIAL